MTLFPDKEFEVTSTLSGPLYPLLRLEVLGVDV